MNKKKYLQTLILTASVLASFGSLQASAPTITSNNPRAGKKTISGTVQGKTALHHTPGAHVHVSLTNSKGVLLEEVIQRLTAGSPRREAGRNYRSHYSVVSKNPDIRKARTVYVDHSHTECPAQNLNPS